MKEAVMVRRLSDEEHERLADKMHAHVVRVLAQQAVEDDPEAVVTPSWWGPGFNRQEATERFAAELVDDGKVAPS